MATDNIMYVDVYSSTDEYCADEADSLMMVSFVEVDETEQDDLDEDEVYTTNHVAVGIEINGVHVGYIDARDLAKILEACPYFDQY